MKSRSYDLPKNLAQKALQEADELLRKQHEKGIFDDGDPNHPKYNNGINYTRPLFGHEIQAFLQKQYK